MVRFIFLPLWRHSIQKTRRQGSRSPCRCHTCRVVFGSAPVVRCPKPWLLRWANIPLRSTRATSLRPLSDTSWTWGVPCTFQSPPANIWSTSFLKKMAKNVVFWISSPFCHAATWHPWIFASVMGSRQQRGKNCMEPIGPTWRRHISLSVSQREIVEGIGFSCFLRAFYLSRLETVWIQKLCQICEVVVCELELTWMGLRWNVRGLVAFPTEIVSDKTLQVLQQRHARSRWNRRFAWSLEPVAAAGRLGSFLL